MIRLLEQWWNSQVHFSSSLKYLIFLGDTGKAQSTLKADVEHFVLTIAAMALVQAIVVFVVGCIQGLDPFTAFIQGFIIIMVANVPQGLPSTITAALFIVAERMGKQNVFVKKLDVIETLGSCTLICTDKTGTLTQNLMSVANLWVMGAKMTEEEAQASLADHTNTPKSLRSLLDIVSLNSRAIKYNIACFQRMVIGCNNSRFNSFALSSNHTLVHLRT